MNKWFVSFISVWLTLVTPAIAANTIFSDGFESGNTSAWSSCPHNVGTPPMNLVQSVTVRTGTFALRSNWKSDQYNPCTHSPLPAPTSTRHYVSFWVNWGSQYSCRAHWWRMGLAGGGYFDYNHDFAPCRFAGQTYSDIPHFSSGVSDLVTWVLKDPFVNLATSTPLANGDAGSQTFVPVILSGWHRVEMLLYLNTPGVSDGTVKVWVNGIYAVNSDSSELQPYSVPISPGVPYITGDPKQPRGGSSGNVVDLLIMTNLEPAHTAASCSSKPQPCNNPTLDYFLYIDDVLWADDCPDTGATCSPELTTTVKGKSLRIMEWFIIMLVIGSASLLISNGMKPKRAAAQYY